MTLKNESPLFVGAKEGGKSIQSDHHSNNKQKAFKELRKKLIFLGQQISHDCYKSYPSKAIIEQALSEIRKIRSELYAK